MVSDVIPTYLFGVYKYRILTYFQSNKAKDIFKLVWIRTQVKFCGNLTAVTESKTAVKWYPKCIQNSFSVTKGCLLLILGAKEAKYNLDTVESMIPVVSLLCHSWVTLRLLALFFNFQKVVALACVTSRFARVTSRFRGVTSALSNPEATQAWRECSESGPSAQNAHIAWGNLCVKHYRHLHNNYEEGTPSYRQLFCIFLLSHLFVTWWQIRPNDNQMFRFSFVHVNTHHQICPVTGLGAGANGDSLWAPRLPDLVFLLFTLLTALVPNSQTGLLGITSSSRLAVSWLKTKTQNERFPACHLKDGMCCYEPFAFVFKDDHHILLHHFLCWLRLCLLYTVTPVYSGGGGGWRNVATVDRWPL